jgi:predicted transcriptional regulator of viral defense system
MVDSGSLQRLGRGLYRSSTYVPQVDISLEGLANTASTTPDAVICLISALAYYDLTDEIPREHWIAIPHSKHPSKRAGSRVIQMRNTSLGRQTIKLGEYSVQIFDRERCIIDAFRYLSREVAIKALKSYLADDSHKPDLQKLEKYAKTLRANIKLYVQALIT